MVSRNQPETDGAVGEKLANVSESRCPVVDERDGVEWRVLTRWPKMEDDGINDVE